MAAIPPTHSLDRRSFLRGIGISLALPYLESLAGKTAHGLESVPVQIGKTPAGDPLRTAFLYIPNGVTGNRWEPTGEGSDWKLNETMQPLVEFQKDFQVISGLEHQSGRAGKDGGGDHARATATILTGVRAKKTAGSDIRLGVSADQVIASTLGDKTRFASLELSCDGLRRSGTCDSGYSCAYQFNISWKSESLPLAPESNPRLVFERLFGSGNQTSERLARKAAEDARRSSILDFIREDARSLQKQLGANDRSKLEEYLTGVREIEQRLKRMSSFGPPPSVDATTPAGTPANYEDHMRLMMDLLVLAFQTDSTRVSTFLLAHDGSNRSFQSIGISEGHHELSHHQDDAKKIEKLAQIDLFYTRQLAYLLQRLRDTKEANGKSLLDNSMIVYCGGLSDANRHSHENLPVILAGHGGGLLKPGRHVKAAATPMSNLLLSLMAKMGASADRFGDSTGLLQGI